MQSALYVLTTISVLLVATVLCLGLYSMLHKKSPNLSQTLMRWRVGLQFIAILFIMGFVWFSAT